MTDERIERVRKTLRDSHVWDDLDSLERELTEAKASAAAWEADALLREQNRADLERELTELREAARANTACCESNGCHGNHERLRDALSHYDEVTHG